MEKSLYLGIVLTKQTIRICVVDECGNQIGHMAMSRNSGNVPDLQNWISGITARGTNLYAALGNPEKEVVDFLLRNNMAVAPIDMTNLDQVVTPCNMARPKATQRDECKLAEFLRLRNTESLDSDTIRRLLDEEI